MANKLSKINFKQTKVIVPVVATAVVAIVALIIPAISNAAMQPTVNLGSTSNFAVLAGSGITNTGPTTIGGSAGGDMGSDPTPAFTGDTLVTTTGTKYTAANAVVTAAKTSLVTAYDDAAGRASDGTISADLSGQTLVGGTYTAASSMALNGTLTLDGANNPDSVWVFQAGSTLTTGTGSVVSLINGAQPCHVFWQVGSSATFGTTTDFTGHVFALTSITANTGATFKGQLLARNGAVTLDSNTITNDVCAAAVTPTPTATPSATVSATPSASATIPATTPPTASATPSATPSATVSETPSATPTVVVSESPTPVQTTETGGQLPNTETPWLNVLFFGLVIAAAGFGLVLVRRKRS